MKMKRIMSLFLAILMVMSFSACGSEQQTGQTEDPNAQAEEAKDSLVVRLNLQLTTLDPHTYNSNVVIRVTNQIFEPLVILDESNYELVPCLAKSWTISDDGLVYDFILRDDVKFHNGNAFTAEDVKFSFERVLSGTTLTSFLSAVDTVEIVSDYEVKVILSAANVAFLNKLANITIVDKETFDDASYDINKNPIGCGPYKFVSFDEANQTVTLEAYADYYGGVAPIKNLQFKSITDSTAAALALQSGDIDYCLSLDSNSCIALEAADGVVVESAPTAFLTYAIFNCAIEPTSNKALRQAISYAIDKEAISMVVSDGYNLVADEFQYPGVTGYESGCVKCYEYNPEKAREILKDAGLENVEISFIADRDYVVKFAEVIQSNLKDVGITLNIEQLDAAGYDEKVYGQTYNMGYWTMGGRGSDIDELTTFMSDSPRSITYYNNAVVDQYLIEQSMALDPAERKGINTKMLEAFKEDPPMIPLYFSTDFIAYREGLKTPGIPAFGFVHFNEFSWE